MNLDPAIARRCGGSMRRYGSSKRRIRRLMLVSARADKSVPVLDWQGLRRGVRIGRTTSDGETEMLKLLAPARPADGAAGPRSASPPRRTAKARRDPFSVRDCSASG